MGVAAGGLESITFIVFGAGASARRNLLVAKETCVALQKLLPKKVNKVDR